MRLTGGFRTALDSYSMIGTTALEGMAMRYDRPSFVGEIYLITVGLTWWLYSVDLEKKDVLLSCRRI